MGNNIKEKTKLIDMNKLTATLEKIENIFEEENLSVLEAEYVSKQLVEYVRSNARHLVELEKSKRQADRLYSEDEKSFSSEMVR